MAENEKPQTQKDASSDTVKEEKKTAKSAQAEKKTKSRSKASGEASLAAAEEKLEAANAKADEIQQQLLRTTAEYDNYRKRSQKENDAAFGNGISHAAGMLIPVLDTLEAAAGAPTADEEYKKGVLMTLAKAKDVFEKLGITEIECEGKPFDPQLHNACVQEEKEGVESGNITRVLQKGYMLHGRVVRHAVVAVAP